MFDVGFWELALIGVVVLLVVGPERLPKVVRTAGLWIGRGRRMLSTVKAEIDREIKAQELKEILDQQSRSNPLETILDERLGDKPGEAEPIGAGQDPVRSIHGGSVAKEGSGTRSESVPTVKPGGAPGETPEPPTGRTDTHSAKPD